MLSYDALCYTNLMCLREAEQEFLVASLVFILSGNFRVLVVDTLI